MKKKFYFGITLTILCVFAFAHYCQSQVTEVPISNPDDVKLLEINHWAPDTSALDDSVSYETNYVGFAHDVKHFYEMLHKKDWKAAYEMRWKTFKHDLPESTYLDWAKQSGARWELSNYQILTVCTYGTNDITLICKFVESPGPKISYITVEWHKEGDGVWRCNGAGPMCLPIFLATRHVQTPDDD
jgi:hypothetical protein